MNDKITGKQLLLEYESVLKDTGTYLLELGRSACGKIKGALATDGKGSEADGALAAASTTISANDTSGDKPKTHPKRKESE